MIENRRKAGWAFVFLGANQDSFEAAGGLAVARGATSNFVADERGVRHGWADLSGSTMRARKMLRSGRAQTAEMKANYLSGFNSAELDYQRRGKGHGGGHGAALHGGRRRARLKDTAS